MTSRTAPPARAVLLAAGMLVMTACVTACGTTVAGSGAVTDPSPVPAPGQSTDYAAQAAAAVARHDKLFPEVAAQCEGKASVAPARSAAPDDLPTDPEARKYAENHGYKKEVELTPAAQCRGDAHAARIRAALGGPEGKGAPRTTQELSGLLTGMGYTVDTGDVYASSTGNLSFVLSIPESGPCVTGHVSPPVSVKAHGVYMEGGCREPRGGH
ncbi:hypothetical protein ADK52_07045 [Streptomyces sp. WM6372]|uniref:hypothetical protein n=1 Tax=Streptomyces sp. WM6372 TaxID=1415555 RepID=UPI0006AE6C20|nr:hypothetical protein [Streptomyces sp. WM6372]KOU28604.1 hypothetical protein ADK52_07045 [Streptomyces sp. WM6372]